MFNHVHSLGNLVQMVPIIKASIPADLSIAICDSHKFIAYFPGDTIHLNIKEGQLLNKDEPLSIALRENKALKSNVPADFYGFEFIGTATPIHDQTGKVIGGIAVQLRRQTELREIADKISMSLSQAADRINSAANGSNQLATYTQELLVQSENAGEDVNHSTEVLTIIKKVATETNLLGLNAAIEAARAGEKGKGFEVVANEIRKFSKETVASTKKINETMTRIKEVTNRMGVEIGKIATIGQEQAATIQQISAFIEEINEMAKKLNQFANKL